MTVADADDRLLASAMGSEQCLKANFHSFPLFVFLIVRNHKQIKGGRNAHINLFPFLVYPRNHNASFSPDGRSHGGVIFVSNGPFFLHWKPTPVVDRLFNRSAHSAEPGAKENGCGCGCVGERFWGRCGRMGRHGERSSGRQNLQVGRCLLFPLFTVDMGGAAAPGK